VNNSAAGENIAFEHPDALETVEYLRLEIWGRGSFATLGIVDCLL
jgi:hypothetical protein